MDFIDVILGSVKEVFSAAETDTQIIYAIEYDSGVEDTISSGVLRQRYPQLIIEYFESLFRQRAVSGTRILDSMAVFGTISARLVNNEVKIFRKNNLGKRERNLKSGFF